MTLRLNIQKIISSIDVIFNSTHGNCNKKLPQSHMQQALIRLIFHYDHITTKRYA